MATRRRKDQAEEMAVDSSSENESGSGSFVGFDEDSDNDDQFDNSDPEDASGSQQDSDAFDSEDEQELLRQLQARKNKKKKKTDVAFADDDEEMEDKDSDEEDLENFVLGNKDNFRAQLFRDDFLAALTGDIEGDKEKQLVKGTGNEEIDDSQLFFVDTGADEDQRPDFKGLPMGGAEGEVEEQPAWEDSDDERLQVSLAGATRLRKLRTAEAEDIVNGTEYARRLRQQYLRLYPLPEWANQGKDNKRRRRRSSAAGSSSGSDAEVSSDEEDEAIDSAMPLESFLRDANSFAVGKEDGSRKRRKLRPETIDIQRSRDIPDTHKAAVSSLSFHPRQPILLSCSVSSILYLHKVDPAAYPTPNPCLTSVQVKRTDLRRSAFLGPDGEEVLFAGRRRYFHSWNLGSGQVKKVTQIQGHQKEMRTMERFRTSPCGRYMALITSEKKGGGMLNIVNVRTMQWIAQARTNGRGGISDFQWWSTGNGLSILGKDGQVTEWSMLAKRTVGVWRDEGSIGGTVLALGGGRSAGGPALIGGDRWVAVGSNSGILNVYDRNDLVEKSAKTGEVTVKALPTPTRTLEQLTTAISVVTFSPDGQLLAFGSLHKKDALRLVHMPSCTVYRNWPTEQTPLGRITAVAFSAGSDTLAVGNDVGKIRMWEIRA